MTAKLCQFPPSGGSVTVTHEDYTCLADESFLNDTIIEFYFKWLQCEVMSEKDRNRTHFFTTYFYNKLTKRPVRNRNKIHPVEDNQVMLAILSEGAFQCFIPNPFLRT